MSNLISKAKRALLMQINPALSRPKSARLIVTINCPFRCQTCTFPDHPYWKDKKIDPDLATVKYWIKEMADFGVKEIDIGGGEPLVRKDITEIVKEIKSYGMRCSFTTNGWLVDKVPFPPVDSCEISIDGARPETHDKIRGIKGSWERAVQAVKIAKQHCLTHINFVIQADNYTEMTEYCKLAKDLGVLASFIPVSTQLAAQPALPQRLKEYDLPVLRKQIADSLKTGVVLDNGAYYQDFLKIIEQKPDIQRCMAPYRVIVVFYNGYVYPCGNFDMPVGRLLPGVKFQDIYASYKNLRKKVWQGQHEFCSACVYADRSNRRTILSSIIPFIKRTITG